MRHPQLHAALRTGTSHASRELRHLVEDGDEVPYELLEHRRPEGRGRREDGLGAVPSLYSYRPLVGLYVERHAEDLDTLPALAEAAHALVAALGVEAYLHARGVDRPQTGSQARAALAVRLFLERVFDDDPTFAVDDERFERAFAELEATLGTGATETMVVIPIVGLHLELGTIAVTRGVALQQPETLRGSVPEAALSGPDGEADAVATLRWPASPDAPETPGRALEAARRLLVALRLHHERAAPAAGPLLWLRAAGGPWRAMALGGTFTARGEAFLGPEDVHDLRTFVDLVGRRLPDRGEVAWALRRWSLGLDRDRPEEALADHLLAARALVEPEGATSNRMAGRLAALCVGEEGRGPLTARLAALAAAEEAVVRGRRTGVRDLPGAVDELADCLRAVLRDSVCGYLEGDLSRLADDVLDGVGSGDADLTRLGAGDDWDDWDEGWEDEDPVLDDEPWVGRLDDAPVGAVAGAGEGVRAEADGRRDGLAVPGGEGVRVIDRRGREDARTEDPDVLHNPYARGRGRTASIHAIAAADEAPRAPRPADDPGSWGTPDLSEPVSDGGDVDHPWPTTAAG